MKLPCVLKQRSCHHAFLEASPVEALAHGATKPAGDHQGGHGSARAVQDGVADGRGLSGGEERPQRLGERRRFGRVAAGQQPPHPPPPPTPPPSTPPPPSHPCPGSPPPPRKAATRP